MLLVDIYHMQKCSNLKDWMPTYTLHLWPVIVPIYFFLACRSGYLSASKSFNSSDLEGIDASERNYLITGANSGKWCIYSRNSVFYAALCLCLESWIQGNRGSAELRHRLYNRID